MLLLPKIIISKNVRLSTKGKRKTLSINVNVLYPGMIDDCFHLQLTPYPLYYPCPWRSRSKSGDFGSYKIAPVKRNSPVPLTTHFLSIFRDLQQLCK